MTEALRKQDKNARNLSSVLLSPVIWLRCSRLRLLAGARGITASIRDSRSSAWVCGGAGGGRHGSCSGALWGDNFTCSSGVRRNSWHVITYSVSLESLIEAGLLCCLGLHDTFAARLDPIIHHASSQVSCPPFSLSSCWMPWKHTSSTKMRSWIS